MFAIFIIGMNPPVIGLFNRATTVLGFGSLYIWLVVMTVYVSLVLVWIARSDGFALSESQVPPELRDRDDVVTTTDGAQKPDEETTPGGDV